MKRLIGIILLFGFTGGYSQTVENHLQTESTIQFDQKNYNLVWSSHPNETYYKQEYLTNGQNVERFKSMLLIDFIIGDFSVEDVVKFKIQELEKAKKSNPIVNFTVLEKNGETIIDFLMSANSKDGKKIEIIERNVYRYLKVKTKKGSGVLLFAVSERAYKEEIDQFFKELKENKNSLIMKVGNMKIPKIEPKN